MQIRFARIHKTKRNHDQIIRFIMHTVVNEIAHAFIPKFIEFLVKFQVLTQLST